MRKERTPEATIAALENCSTKDVCAGCPYVEIEASYCQSSLMRDAGEHLKHLKEENERLKAEREEQKKQIDAMRLANMLLEEELEELRPLAAESIPEDAFPSDAELRGEEYYACHSNEGDV